MIACDPVRFRLINDPAPASNTASLETSMLAGR